MENNQVSQKITFNNAYVNFYGYTKKEIIKGLSKIIPETNLDIGKILEVSKKKKFGDYVLPCFKLAKDFKLAPIKISEIISKRTTEYFKEK